MNPKNLILIKTRIKIKKKKKIRTIRIRIQKIILQNRKVYLNFLFNFIFLNFCFCTVLTFAISYYYSLKGSKKVFRGAVRNDFKTAYFLPLIFSKFNPTIFPETEPIISYSFSMFNVQCSMFILSLIILICFFNIMSYILSIYLIYKYNVEINN